MKLIHIHYWNFLLAAVATGLVFGNVIIPSVSLTYYSGGVAALAIYSALFTVGLTAVVKKETAIDVLKDLRDKLDTGGKKNGQ